MPDVTITKTDEQRNLVFGWAYTSVTKDGEQVIDHSGEMIDPVDLEDAAYLFNIAFRKTGEMHEGDALGELVESFVSTEEKQKMMGLPSGTLPQGWWVGFYIDDDQVFEKVKSGEYQMFSIQGRASREEVS